MRGITLAAVATVLCVLAACGPRGPDAEGVEAADSGWLAPAPGDTASAPDTPAAVVDSLFLALEGEGLRAFLASTGSARPLPFGTSAAEALRTLNAVLRAPPIEQGENVDCALEYAAWDNGLTVWFARGQFAGWSIAQGSSLTTANGVGLGTTRTDLVDAYAPAIMRTSLGEEFTAGGMAGVLDSPAPDARVLHLWSGQACIAR